MPFAGNTRSRVSRIATAFAPHVRHQVHLAERLPRQILGQVDVVFALAVLGDEHLALLDDEELASVGVFGEHGRSPRNVHHAAIGGDDRDLLVLELGENAHLRQESDLFTEGDLFHNSRAARGRSIR